MISIKACHGRNQCIDQLTHQNWKKFVSPVAACWSRPTCAGKPTGETDVGRAREMSKPTNSTRVSAWIMVLVADVILKGSGQTVVREAFA